jgi:predicted adenine nucleotide alpha hydrolase (AANH) superfamily ATPase
MIDFNVCVIGLKARKDRWARCKEVLQGRVERVTHYTTVQNFQDSYKGYMTDWMKMLKMFQGGPLMFFEDDFEFTDDFDEVFTKAIAELPQSYDMLYLGANLQAPVTRYSDHLVRVNGAWLMHATLLSAKFIDFIIDNYPNSNIRIADEWYRRIAPQREFYMTVPMISYQRKDYSDFVGRYVYYDIFSNKYYKRAL